MKNKNILFYILLITIILATIIYLLTNKKEYRYICLNVNLEQEELIAENYLEICTTNKKIPEGVITKKEQLLTEDVYTSYKLVKESYTKGEMLYEKDLILYEHEKATETDIELLTELQVQSDIDEDGNIVNKLIKYDIYIKDNKLYAKNLEVNKEKLIFSEEEVSNIAVRKICCAGDGNLLILTSNGNVYISEKDINYSFNFNFPFTKLEVTDIVSFKLIPIADYDFTKNLYGVNSKGEEILLQKLN